MELPGSGSTANGRVDGESNRVWAGNAFQLLPRAKVLAAHRVWVVSGWQGFAGVGRRWLAEGIPKEDRSCAGGSTRLGRIDGDTESNLAGNVRLLLPLVLGPPGPCVPR